MISESTSNNDYPSVLELIDLEMQGQMLAHVLHPDLLEKSQHDTDKSATTILELALAKGSGQLRKVIGEAQLLENIIKKILKAPYVLFFLFYSSILNIYMVVD